MAKIHLRSEEIEKERMRIYNECVDLNPSFREYSLIFGLHSNYRTFRDLSDFAGRITAKRSSFEIESLALSLAFIRHHSIN